MSDNLAARAFKLAVLGMALFCALGLWRAIATMGLRLPIDPNEGWNAYHAAAAMAGAPLYPGAQSTMINNYPPLSFYLAGALGRVLGDNIFAGRIVSLLSFFFVTFGIFAAGLHLGYQVFGWQHFFARVDLNGSAAIIRQRVVTQSGENIFAAPAAYISVAGGVGVSF